MLEIKNGILQVVCRSEMSKHYLDLLDLVEEWWTGNQNIQAKCLLRTRPLAAHCSRWIFTTGGFSLNNRSNTDGYLYVRFLAWTETKVIPPSQLLSLGVKHSSSRLDNAEVPGVITVLEPHTSGQTIISNIRIDIKEEWNWHYTKTCTGWLLEWRSNQLLSSLFTHFWNLSKTWNLSACF